MKINQQGTYLPFAGVTVIATLLKQDETFWHKMQALIHQPLICKYFTPVPYESYHMTTNNLYVEEDCPDWSKFIDNNLTYFHSLSNRLLQNSHNLDVSIVDLKTHNAIQLIVLFDSPDDEEMIHNIAAQYRCADGIPRLFHVTLAYQYQAISNEDNQAMSAIFNAIKQMARDHHITLNPPALHIFRDMTQYTPWDGTANPFQPPINDDVPHDNCLPFFRFR